MEIQSAFFLKYLPMKISLVSIENAKLPLFLGSTLRGAIGQALRTNTTAFNYLYNNRIFNEYRQDIVNPYIIVPPPIDKTLYHAGDELNFYIILFGKAVEYTQELVDSLQNIQTIGLGVQRNPFKLKKIIHSIDQRVIWKNGLFNKIATRSAVLPYLVLPYTKQLTLQIHTPLRIRRNGSLLKTFDFPTIIRNITNRIEAITSRYGGWVDQTEIDRIKLLASDVSILQDCLEMKDMQRYSNRLKEKMDFGGLIGSIQFEGNLTPFVPWLYAAQILHVGRNTTFGMGEIEVEFT